MAHTDGVVIVNQKDKTVTIGNKVYSFPKGMKGSNVTTINNKSYIDGFELTNGEWKKTLKVLWYKYF